MTGCLTWSVPGVYVARADGHEEDPFFLVHSVVVRDRHVDGRLADDVGTRHVDLQVVDEIRGRHAGGKRQDFLGGAFAQEGDEGVDGLDYPDDVGSEAACQVFG